MMKQNQLFIATFSNDAAQLARAYGIGLELNHTCISVSYTHLDVYKRQADDRYHDVLLLELAGADRDDGVSDGADADTVGDGVSQRHRDQRQERRCCGAEVTHVYILEVAKHQHADINQCRSCRTGRNDARERCQEQA